MGGLKQRKSITMQSLNDKEIKEMVEQVISHLQGGWSRQEPPIPGKSASTPVGQVSVRWNQQPQASFPKPYSAVSAVSPGSRGLFRDVDQAVSAAKTAQKSLNRRSLAQRKVICDLIKQICLDQAEELGRMEYEETGIGHPAHKPEKMRTVAEGALGVEALTSECFSGDHGITVEEHAPWGVIGIVTPVTHSLPTLANNAINMIAAGNSLVCNPHPGGKKIAAHGARLFNEAIYRETGIDNLIGVITEPTLESAKQLFTHPEVDLLGITGGPGVVAAALQSGKRAICAGPGNPPVVVDASADLDNAANCIIEGSTYDNNLLCLSEKETFVEAPVFESFLKALEKAGAIRLTTRQMDQLAQTCLVKGEEGHWAANREYVGAEPEVFARLIGVSIPPNCRMLFGETGPDHPWVMAEQMMPVMPVVKSASFEEAVDSAQRAEHGFKHTAVIHSRLVDHMTYMGKALDTTLYVKNGPSLAGNGAGGEGYGGWSIACGTGEGIATPMTYTRVRRCAMIDNLRIL